MGKLHALAAGFDHKSPGLTLESYSSHLSWHIIGPNKYTGCGKKVDP